MKRFALILLGLLLCFAVFVLPAAAEDATEPEPTTQAQEKTTEPTEPVTEPQPEAPAFSPYAAPNWEDYEGDSDAYYNAFYEWETSIYGRYCSWSGRWDDQRGRFDPAFRAFYADDPEMFITDHFVYRKVTGYEYEGKKRVKRTFAVIYDYFDTEEAAAACKTLRIPAEIDGYRVLTNMHDDSSWTGGVYDGGYTNDTVKKLIIEEGVKTISSFAFSNFTALKAVRIPQTITKIGVGAFQNCTALKKVYGCEGLETVMSSAFAGCKKLYSFACMDKIRYFEGGSFSGCGFKTLSLAGNAVLGGGDEDYYEVWRVFDGCKKLKKVAFLPTDQKANLNIGNEAFRDCTALKTVVLPKQCGKIFIGDYAFQNCAALETLKNTDRLATLERRVFEGCAAFRSLTLPAGFQNGAYDTFRGSSLKELDIRSKETKLFDGSYESYWLYQGDVDEYIDQNFLKELPKTCTVYVVSKDMKNAVKSHGFKGTVRIRVFVGTPQGFTSCVNDDGTVTFVWDPVKKATGYRLYIFDAKKDCWVALQTTKKPYVTIKPQQLRAGYSVRAYRVVDGDKSWSGYSDYAKLRLG